MAIEAIEIRWGRGRTLTVGTQGVALGYMGVALTAHRGWQPLLHPVVALGYMGIAPTARRGWLRLSERCGCPVYMGIALTARRG